MSLFNPKFTFTYQGRDYEKLEVNEHMAHEFRVIIDSDDYDYVEDWDLIEELRDFWYYSKNFLVRVRNCGGSDMVDAIEAARLTNEQKARLAKLLADKGYTTEEQAPKGG